MVQRQGRLGGLGVEVGVEVTCRGRKGLAVELKYSRSSSYAIFESMGRWRTFLIGFVLFLIGALLSYCLEGSYHGWVRSLCTAQGVRFAGKYVQLFESPWFLFGSAIWSLVAFLLIKKFTWQQGLIRLLIAVAVFFSTVFVLVSGWAASRVMQCTACDDGVRIMRFVEVPKDGFFVTALVLSLFALLVRRSRG